MKKNIFLVLLVIMAIVMTACGKNKKTSKETEADDDEVYRQTNYETIFDISQYEEDTDPVPTEPEDMSGYVTWSVENGKLTITGKGEVPREKSEFIDDGFSGYPLWYSMADSITTAYVDISDATDMSMMFGCLENLTSIEFGSNFDTSNVINMSMMFYDCAALRSVDLSSFDTSKVTDMSDMFSYTGLDSVDVSGFNTSKVTNMSHMFYGCRNLVKPDISNFDKSKVTDDTDMMGP